MSRPLRRVWVFGDDIDTDALAPGAYLKQPIADIARHCLESVDPTFAADVRPGDVVVAGRNFGIGSSREQAPEALRHLGVAAVLARSFAGLFYRNALNVGLLALVCPDAARIRAGTSFEFDAEAARIVDVATGAHYDCEPVPPHLLEMVRAGGLLPYLARRLALQRQSQRQAPE